MKQMRWIPPMDDRVKCRTSADPLPPTEDWYRWLTDVTNLELGFHRCVLIPKSLTQFVSFEDPA